MFRVFDFKKNVSLKDIINEYFMYLQIDKRIFALDVDEDFKDFVDIYGVYVAVSCYNNLPNHTYLYLYDKSTDKPKNLSVSDIYKMMENYYSLDFFKKVFEKHNEKNFEEFFFMNKIKEILYPKKIKYHFETAFEMERVDFHSEEMRNKLHKIVDDYIDNFGKSKNEYKDLCMNIYDEK